MMSSSGSANMGGQMPWKCEEFHMFLIVDEYGVSLSPSWCLTATLLNLGALLDGICYCPQLTGIVDRCQMVMMTTGKVCCLLTHTDKLPSVLRCKWRNLPSGWMLLRVWVFEEVTYVAENCFCLVLNVIDSHKGGFVRPVRPLHGPGGPAARPRPGQA